jgi:hypothetical protein
MIQLEAKEILQTLPKKIEIERLQRYQSEIQNLKQENQLLKERINMEEKQAMIQDTWYDGTEATDEIEKPQSTKSQVYRPDSSELLSKEKSEAVENNSFDETNVDSHE